jgi:hypothetical protein
MKAGNTMFVKEINRIFVSGLLVLIACCVAIAQGDQQGPIIPNLPATPTFSPSTVGLNGDLNPYGIAVVPHNFVEGGTLAPNDIIVSNFNNSANVQGMGSTIVRIHNGHTFAFFQGQSGLGLTSALGVVSTGFVIVGSLPTTDGTCNTIGQTALLIIDRNGNQVTTLTDANLLNGPWDLTIHDEGERAQVFVSNVLSGTVTRIDLRMPGHDDDQSSPGQSGREHRNGNPIVEKMTRIASGYGHACNEAAVVVGPTGLAYDAARDLLYVASTSDNKIFAVAHAGKTQSDQGTGALIYQDNAHLRGPLGLVMDPDGDLITANGDAINADASQPSELVEFTVIGQFVGQFSVDPSEGAAFGMAVEASGEDQLQGGGDESRGHEAVRFAAGNDVTNVLNIWELQH